MDAFMCYLTMRNCLLIIRHLLLESSSLVERMFTSHNRMLNKTIFAVLLRVFRALEAVATMRVYFKSWRME